MAVKTYRITMRRGANMPKSIRVPRLAMTFKPGVPVTTASAEALRYAKRRPHEFAVELLSAKKARAVPAPPPPKPEPEPEVKASPTELWLDLWDGEDPPTISKCKKFADEYDIDLDGAKLKSDIIEAIEVALEDM
jgi:hypothetical protein